MSSLCVLDASRRRIPRGSACSIVLLTRTMSRFVSNITPLLLLDVVRSEFEEEDEDEGNK